MKTQLKYLKLFEGISQSDIPYSDNQTIGDTIKCIINIYDSELTELPEIYNQLTNEIGGYISIHGNQNLTHIDSFKNLTEIGGDISIENNPNLTHITGFNSLTKIGDYISICDNPNLTHIPGFSNLTEIDGYIMIYTNKNLTHIKGFDNLTKIEGEFLVDNNEKLEHIKGFNNLTEIGGYISITNNPNLTHITGFDNLTEINGNIWLSPPNKKLISMSIPHTLIESVDYVEGGIYGEIKYTSPVEFINHPNIVNECIYKFDPAIHPDVVVKQIIENLELWGEPETIKTIINHILSKGDYWEYIPKKFYKYVEEKYHHLYNAKYANTGARGIAKMNTGRYLGMF